MNMPMACTQQNNYVAPLLKSNLKIVEINKQKYEFMKIIINQNNKMSLLSTQPLKISQFFSVQLNQRTKLSPD